MKSINLNQLLQLVYLLEERSVSKASERAGISQPAMSKVLKALREHFQDPLLARSGNEMVMSMIGSSLLAELQPIFQQLDVIVEPKLFNPKDCDVEFTIASSEYFGSFVLPNLVNDLFEVAPLLRVGLRNWLPASMKELEYGRMDFGTTIYTNKPELPITINSECFGEDHLVCITDKSHRLASKKLTLTDYLNSDHIAISSGEEESNLEKYFRVNGDQRRIKLKVAYFSSAIALLRGSQYCVTLPLHIAGRLSQHHDLCIKQYPIPSPNLKYHLLWPILREHESSHQWIRQYLLEYKRKDFSNALLAGQKLLEK